MTLRPSGGEIPVVPKHCVSRKNNFEKSENEKDCEEPVKAKAPDRETKDSSGDGEDARNPIIMQKGGTKV